MAERCAVIGVGQTHHKAKREDVSIAGLVREAAKMALADADLTWSDIEAVVIGKAPDMFEGNMMPELYLAPALGPCMFPISESGISTPADACRAALSGARALLVGETLVRTPVDDLWICGSGAHPGGGLMGAPGRIAALELLRERGRRKGVRGRL